MIEKRKWKEVSNKIHRHYPELCDAIARIEPLQKSDVYVARYSYGEKIVDEAGCFKLPTKTQEKDSFRIDFNYCENTLPFGLVLSGQCEEFLEKNDPIHGFTESLCSLRIHQDGDFIGHESLFGCEKYKGTVKPYQMSSGLRSVFIVPGIRNVTSFERLQHKFNGYRKLEMPMSIRDHGRLFQQIANHKNFSMSWGAEIILFPGSWLDYFRGKKQETSLSISHLTNQYISEQKEKTGQGLVCGGLEMKAWEMLIGHYNQYPHVLIEKAKSILLAGLGKKPVYQVCTVDDGGPFTALADEFYQAYRWQRYAPVFMVPAYLDWTKDRVGYYSMTQPMTSKIDNGSYKSKAADAAKVKNVIDIIMKRTMGFTYLLKEAGLETLSSLNITFHHYDANKTSGMLPSKGLFDGNEVVAAWKSQDKDIAYSNHFLRCCARISKKLLTA